MPVMDGLTAIREIRKSGRFGGRDAVLLTKLRRERPAHRPRPAWRTYSKSRPVTFGGPPGRARPTVRNSSVYDQSNDHTDAPGRVEDQGGKNLIEGSIVMSRDLPDFRLHRSQLVVVRARREPSALQMVWPAVSRV